MTQKNLLMTNINHNMVKTPRYYDPNDKIPDKIMYGRAIPLKLDCSIFVRTNEEDLL